MEKFFNTAGPISPDLHYHIPSLERIDWPEIQMLIASQGSPKQVVMKYLNVARIFRECIKNIFMSINYPHLEMLLTANY
jgi:hypothetical protein